MVMDVIKHYRELARKDPDNPHHHVHLARHHMGQGNHDHAADALRKAIDIDPNDEHSWNHMAYLIKLPKNGNVDILESAFNTLNSYHPGQAEHQWHIIRNKCTLEDVEKFAEIGYKYYRQDQKISFLKFLFHALSEINTERKNVFLNLDWIYSNENTISIKSEIPHIQLNIFCHSAETLTDMSEKDLLIIGNVKNIEFLHDCKIFLSSHHSLKMNHVTHCKVFVRNNISEFNKISHCLPIKIGGNVDLANLRVSEHSSWYVYGEARDLGVQGSNFVHLRKKNVSEGEQAWWTFKPQ